MIIDLSVVLNEQTPVYPGDPAFKVAPAGQIAKDGFNSHYISMGTHVGTHIDAPMHMLEAGDSLETTPVDHLVGAGRSVPVTDGNFEAVYDAGIQEGDIVFFNTGMSQKYHEQAYFEDYPAMPVEVARYLVDAKVKMVGIDTCSIDNEDGFPVHKTLLSNGILIIENLTALDTLKGKSFKVYALPLKLRADGAPARVIAEVQA